MFRRLFAVTVFVLAFAGTNAGAAAVEVSVRVEGLSRTTFEGTVDTAIHKVDGGDGTGLQTCSGPGGEAPSASLTGALDDAMKATRIDWHGSWDASAGDFLIDSIGGEDSTPASPWSTLLNGVPTPTGGCTTRVAAGDRILLAYDAVFRDKSLRLAGPGQAEAGEIFTLRVTDDRRSDQPVAGATVSGPDGSSAITGSDGRATFVFDREGDFSFKAGHPDGIRSNAVQVCVGVQAGGCEAAPAPIGKPTRIDKIGQGQLFIRAAAPRILRGQVNGASGVRIALLRTDRKPRKKLRWKPARVNGSAWSRRIASLHPGRYRVFSRAIGSDVRQPWIRGINRIDFRISRRGIAAYRLRTRATQYLRRAARTSEVRASPFLSGWVSLGLRPRGPASEALLDRVRPGPQLPDGSFGGDLNTTAMASVALSRSDPLAAARATAWIITRQGAGGGFSYADGAAPDVDTSGLAAWALTLTGRWRFAKDAARFIESAQSDDGGLPAVIGGKSNAQSTGLGLLGMRAAGMDPRNVLTEDRITPLHYLATLQRKTGAIDYSPGLATTPSWVTAQALLGLTARKDLLRK